MRIITGKARGLKLFTPKDYRVRPTSDRVKEALFNIIAAKIPGSLVLDAFAGTGNLGLEAWSRGAAHVWSVDMSADSLKLIKANVAKARAEQDITILKGEAVEQIARLARQKQQFDLIFSDPPYDKGLNKAIYEALKVHPVLKQGGLLVLEHSLQENPSDYLPPDTKIRTEKYGDTKISLLEWK